MEFDPNKLYQLPWETGLIDNSMINHHQQMRHPHLSQFKSVKETLYSATGPQYVIYVSEAQSLEATYCVMSLYVSEQPYGTVAFKYLPDILTPERIWGKSQEIAEFVRAFENVVIWSDKMQVLYTYFKQAFFIEN